MNSENRNSHSNRIQVVRMKSFKICDFLLNCPENVNLTPDFLKNSVKNVNNDNLEYISDEWVVYRVPICCLLVLWAQMDGGQG